MNNLETTFTILLSVFAIAFDFWWALLLAPITAKPKRRNKSSIFRNILIMWIFLAIMRFVLIFNPESNSGWFVSEPRNTQLFVLCGIGLFALYILIQRRNRQQFIHKTGAINTVEDLLKLTPTEFENMVVEIYQLVGHEAKRTGSVGDNGVDVVVQAKNGQKWIVQCKRWKGSVGAPIIRDFYGAMQHEKADKGIIITSGHFTQQAITWSAGKPIVLYDGEKFLKAWKQTQKTRKINDEKMAALRQFEN